MIFQSAHRIKSFFPYKDKINRSQMSKVVYKASCWDCQDFYIGKTKRRLHDRKTEHFKGITSACHASLYQLISQPALMNSNLYYLLMTLLYFLNTVTWMHLPSHLNDQLKNVSTWLKANKLSINVKVPL